MIYVYRIDVQWHHGTSSDQVTALPEALIGISYRALEIYRFLFLIDQRHAE